MGSFSIWHWLIVLAVVLLLFGGRGKISSLMGDFGKGMKAFKKNIKDGGDEEDEPAPVQPKVIPAETGTSGTATPAAEVDTSKKTSNG